jgi:hypothetical protein
MIKATATMSKGMYVESIIARLQSGKYIETIKNIVNGEACRVHTAPHGTTVQ